VLRAEARSLMDEDERRRVAHLLEQAELIERVARVLGEAMEGITPEGWDRQPESLQDDLRDGAAAVLIYLMTAEGWGRAREEKGEEG
jgi:hypothetical protein